MLSLSWYDNFIRDCYNVAPHNYILSTYQFFFRYCPSHVKFLVISVYLLVKLPVPLTLVRLNLLNC